ncbi:pyruvate, phosphate dikinase [Limibaculum sp. M0105]|uniref:Pyruvate, phosphate dikinase n=1 Tax=Thermohalobaculum xanthum TaxID=2753746 RepID=A0A8J7SH96_9RHOB|nr:pyruvate, phosphate dikinase [Thermohalobaculum xanthum]MBK0400617.1 pyruvate, phosphate dikinase [Thermohalobaculum xanthum]
MKDHAAGIGWIGLGAGAPAPAAARFGQKAALLAEAAGLGLPVPPGFVLAPDVLADPAATRAALDIGLARLEAETGYCLGCAENPLLLAVRPSVEGGGGGVIPAILDIGVTEAALPAIAARRGERVARDLLRRLVQSYGATALGIEGEEFEFALYDAMKLAGVESETELDPADLADLCRTCLRLIEEEAGVSFPQEPRAQLDGAVAAIVKLWTGARARTRRVARGLPEDAPLALIVQAMALGIGPGVCGAGVAQTRDETTGARRLAGRFLEQAQGEEALMGLRTPALLTVVERLDQGLREPALEERCPAATEALLEAARALEHALGDAFSFEFTLDDGVLHLLEVKPARRSPRAAVRIAVELAEAGAITRDEALLRIDPAALDQHLHPSIDPDAARDRIGKGLPASPGAASGALVFSPDAAELAAAAGRPAILALIETSPEDIRGMHAAKAVLTVRGGMTSHAAVVARGLGTPCVVGAKDLILDRAAGEIRARDGRVFRIGDAVTVDGSTGEVLAGAVPTVPPEITGAFARLMDWADAARRMGVRANADTAQDARIAHDFGAAGIGLCRTEHMFFKRGRIAAMRRMILAENEADRRDALAELLPMQREDFIELFAQMAGHPVVIRLLDPPLHEFLPHGEADIEELAIALGLSPASVRARVLELSEFNPMLGKRGCRIGIAYPEIYETQARAIFEAALEAGARAGSPVVPEIMLPLVSAVRELVVLKEHIHAVAEAVRAERGAMVDYRVGVMIETPRACLRAGEIADAAAFVSFGTNDLTQMVYGLSRDDAGRFMPDYVARGVYAHDPFHSLDLEGVGEMMRIAAERARAHMPGISVGLCGEHGADPASVEFCEQAGFDYVSCSPFRVPIARLAAAQAAIHARRAGSARDA